MGRKELCSVELSGHEKVLIHVPLAGEAPEPSQRSGSRAIHPSPPESQSAPDSKGQQRFRKSLTLALMHSELKLDQDGTQPVTFQPGPRAQSMAQERRGEG